MSCNLVSPFGNLASEDTQLTQADLLRDLIIQIKILNIHLAKLSDERVLEEDVLNGDYE